MGLVAMMMAVLAPGAVLAGQMSKAEFRLELRDAIQRLSPKARIDLVGDDEMAILSPDSKAGEAVSLYVGNAYERYLNQPENLEVIIGQMARASLSAEVAPVVTKESLVVLIRPADYLTQPGFKDLKFVTRPFAGDFLEIVAIDSGETFHIALADEIEPLFADTAALWAQARANTLAALDDLQIEILEPGVWTITNESSLALNFVGQPQLWPIHGVTMTGDPVAVFMQRNLLLLADSGDKDRLRRVQTFVKEVGDDPEMISTTIFTRRNGVWSVLEQRP